jgi:hypothetical protein
MAGEKDDELNPNLTEEVDKPLYLRDDYQFQLLSLLARL